MYIYIYIWIQEVSTDCVLVKCMLCFAENKLD